MFKQPKVLGKSKYRKLSAYIPGFLLILFATIIIWSVFQQLPKEKEVTIGQTRQVDEQPSEQIAASLLNVDSPINLAPGVGAFIIILGVFGGVAVIVGVGIRAIIRKIIRYFE